MATARRFLYSQVKCSDQTVILAGAYARRTGTLPCLLTCITIFSALAVSGPAAAQLPPGVPEPVRVAEWAFLQEEAIEALEALGKPADLTPVYARSAIRAYVFGRLITIIQKEPADRTPEEKAAFLALQDAVKQNREWRARNALEYWRSIRDDDPCWGSPIPGATVSPPPNVLVSLFCELLSEKSGAKPNQREMYRGQGAAEVYGELLSGNGQVETRKVVEAMDWFAGGHVHDSGALFEPDSEAENNYQAVMNAFRSFRDGELENEFLLSLLHALGPGSLGTSFSDPAFIIQALLVLGTTVWDQVDFQVIGADLQAELSDAQSATPDLNAIVEGQMLELTLVFMGKVLSFSSNTAPCGFNADFNCNLWDLRETDPDYVEERYGGLESPRRDTGYYIAIKREGDPDPETSHSFEPPPYLGSGIRLWSLPVPDGGPDNGEIGTPSTRLHDPLPPGANSVDDLRVDPGIGLSSYLSGGLLVHRPMDGSGAVDDDNWKYGTTLKYRDWQGQYWEAMFVDGTFLHLRDSGVELEGAAQVAGFIARSEGDNPYTYCQAWTTFVADDPDRTRSRDISGVDGRCLLLSHDFGTGQVSVGDQIEFGGQIRTIQAKVNCEGTDLENSGGLFGSFFPNKWCDEGNPGFEPLNPATLNWGKIALLLDAPISSLIGEGLDTGPSRRRTMRRLEDTNTCPAETTGLSMFFGSDCARRSFDPRDFQHCPRFGDDIGIDTSLSDNPNREYIFDDAIWAGDFAPLDCYYSPMIRFQDATGTNFRAIYLRDATAEDDEYIMFGGQDVLEVVLQDGVIQNDKIPSSESITDKSGYRAELTHDPEHGTVVLNQDGSFTYTRGESIDNTYNCGPPGSPYCGPDSFDYRVCADRDGRTDCDFVTVFLEVRNAPPEVYGVSFETIAGGFRANYQYYDPDGDPEQDTEIFWIVRLETGQTSSVRTVDVRTIPDTVDSPGGPVQIEALLEIQVTPKASRGSWPPGVCNSTNCGTVSSEDFPPVGANYLVDVTCSTQLLLSDTDTAECVFSPYRNFLPFGTDDSVRLRFHIDDHLEWEWVPNDCELDRIDGFVDVGTNTCTSTLQRNPAIPDDEERLQGVVQVFINDEFVNVSRHGLDFYRREESLFPVIHVTQTPPLAGSASCDPNPVPATISGCTAQANEGWVFAGWDGDCLVISEECALFGVVEDKRVHAHFKPVISTLVLPPGGGTVDCAPNPVPIQATDESICVANPAAGFQLGSWSGDCDDILSSGSCRLENISSPQSVTAHFALADPAGDLPSGSTVHNVTVLSDHGWTMTSETHATLPTLGWIPLTGSSNSPEFPPPEWADLIYDSVFKFVLVSGTPGSTAEATITFPDPVPPEALYWKFHRDALRWYALDPALYEIEGNTVTLFLTDGGFGDHDDMVNGIIVDPGALVILREDFNEPVPALSWWSLLMLSLLLGGFGLHFVRRT